MIHKQLLAQQGFTLVELAVVLVILGLIIGGVLVGQTLIVASKIRAQITQLDQFDVAISAFRSRYGCLPGDCSSAAAPAGSTIAVDNGGAVGDGTIDYVPAATNTDESSVVWQQLQTAGVIGGSYTPADAGVAYTGGLPQAKAGGFVAVGGIAGIHYFMIGNVDAASPVGFTPVVSAYTAALIDKKRDDGHPLTGAVVAYGLAAGGASSFNGNPFATPNAYVGNGNSDIDCSDSTPLTGAYQSGKDTALCLLKIRVSGSGVQPPILCPVFS